MVYPPFRLDNNHGTKHAENRGGAPFFISTHMVFGHNLTDRLRLNMYPYNRQHWAIFHTNIDRLFAQMVR